MSDANLPTLHEPSLDGLDEARLEEMRAAAGEVAECNRVLGKADLNVVGELLKAQGTFYELDHYPSGDVYDRETHAQYYYHAHRGMAGEHGHFHTFLRAKGMPETVAPAPYHGDAEQPLGDDALTHFVAVSMDRYGFPIGMFATNRWVTAETWYRAEDTIGMVDRFAIDHAYPSWPVNRWLCAMMCLFRPQIVALLEHRDRVVAAWSALHPERDVYEDRELEVTGELRISVDSQAEAVRERLS